MPQVVLRIDAALGVRSQHGACHERIQATFEEMKTGLSRLIGLELRHHFAEVRLGGIAYCEGFGALTHFGQVSTG
jgi:hypothetical protein